MKQSTNFRLSEETILELNMLAEQKRLSKTEIVEKAVRYYLKNKTNLEPKLLKYAGALAEKDADKMLATISKSKYSKKLKVKL